ncbi:MAG: protealysin propeptide domain-containing protein [Enterobacter hormaechei]
MPHLHSVIPPYILRRIIESGSEPQQRCARQTNPRPDADGPYAGQTRRAACE